ncbi:thioesterase-like superfamily-domain-containing protein [Xylaria palmicola]|nr:thioesterase-like superfamily-domain-containing protein [Xylaria palmicola]
MAQDTVLIPFSEATKATCLGPGAYTATILDAFAVGQVPQGGYVATCLLEAVREYMKPRNQPDAVYAHFEFLDRSEPGPALVLIEDVKLGQQISTLHVTMYQRGLLTGAPWVTPKVSRKKIVAYVTCTDLPAQSGLSLPTSFALQPPAPPVDLDRLSKHGVDEHWGSYASRSLEFSRFKVRLWDNIDFYVPLRGQHSSSVVDVWMRLTCGERFTNTSLSFVADAWAHLVEGYRAKPGQAPSPDTFPATSIYWYPTVVFNLELKKGVPVNGADWLRMRVTAKEIRNGRLDMETLIFDRDGELVALSNHFNLILSADRNMAKRGAKSRI